MISNGLKLICMTVLAITLLVASLYANSPMTPFDIAAKNVSDVRIGDPVSVAIDLLSGSEVFGSYKFLVAYDATRLNLVNATIGNDLVPCHWESFSYTLLSCSQCDTRLVEVTAVADLANGGAHPSCLSQFGQVLKLNFNVTIDTLKAGSTAAVNFYWDDCSSNTLGSVLADTVWHGRFVYDQQGGNITDLDPHLGGTLHGCIIPGDIVNVRGANIHDGSVSIRLKFGVYADCNGDGRFNIADIVYLISYVYDGGPAPLDYLHGNVDGDDGVTIADLVFLIHYMFGR
ncbi:MAG: dockerin type I repeat-containing protein [candidate division Zixibacteria bacterium]|nr:dockerin type I repeat-containing protein [candidate division Zixibacteria bacterium]